METIPHKRGDTFNLTCKVPIAFGNALDAVGCQVRLRGNLIEQLTYEVLTPTATEFIYKLSATAEQTELWPLGMLLSDIEYIIDSNVASTETFAINLIEDQTR